MLVFVIFITIIFLNDYFIKNNSSATYFKRLYPLLYTSRKFDKPVVRGAHEYTSWNLDNVYHMIGGPAIF